MDMEKEATPLLEYKKSRTYPSGILSFHLRPLATDATRGIALA